ncbi:hypothetical protein RhiirA4_480922 [Rhizophagus irregularis]|uniref:Uncharacterized protein n=1 Tax=Rhizophagus irregularis TaxID=588596 RepID=A0A2I1HIP6_9GLOM|nr:hypothetical protein RhiirA4_480922 [Rhizophagus irregularis]
MAALEGGSGSGSGSAAQFVAISTICSMGDNIISTSCLYGGTYIQFKVTLQRLGINVKFVQGDDPEEFSRLIDDKTRSIYLESMIAHGEYLLSLIIPLVVLASGYLIKPIEHGANIVVHTRLEIMRNIGPCQNPFGSFLLIQCLETLSLRVHR